VIAPPAKEHPPLADLREMMLHQPLPAIYPETIKKASLTREEPTQQARTVLGRLSAALARDDARALADCFFPEQAYWKESLAMTYHLRTFTTPGVIAANLLKTKELRGLATDLTVKGMAQFHQDLVRET
jgi:hypothetical protein